jgi:NhaP-type Na+/H+ and K+/H+ antiporter
LPRFGTPLLLAFLAIGLLFGKQGRVGLVFKISKPPT